MNTVVFDKTGTLTFAGRGSVSFAAASQPLEPEQAAAVGSLAAQSAHPHSQALAALYKSLPTREVVNFVEATGHGIAGNVRGLALRIGSASWLSEGGAKMPASLAETLGSVSHLSIGGCYAGSFVFHQPLRDTTETLLQGLRGDYELALLSGDNDGERKRFMDLLGPRAALLFNQTPVQKLEWIESRKDHGKRVMMMVGDGLNDAGAFRTADVGVALVDRIGAFSPASDVIMEAGDVGSLASVLKFSKAAARIVRLSFGLSAVYNAVGISIAAAGVLSPILCAVLMPFSSLSVVLMATGLTNRAARRLGIRTAN